ncbi:hypothetical protein QRD90_23120 [Peribacillus frigoritolerans]|uniref:hypothetical protein n=1 Tax=Peribacillus frigoritolerans TaxID=450367 RepID=UPI002079E5DF|nr:hypothetical protein [Peribacillus frigoritolerans]USK79767.1 hypothetical protein LHV56_23580 [Peribacillus frigoritolerans]WJE47055.1 hypothetical protein QRD90_23120 [Peribacillus frigoritolerans]
MTKKKNPLKKTKGKIIQGKTTEDRFKEIHGMTIQGWNAKQEEEFKAKTGMTYDEWYVNQVKQRHRLNLLKNPKVLLQKKM